MSFTDLVLYTGIFVFALTGALKARSHQMDILGASVLAFATAYGGGTLRDLLIGIRVGWINDPVPLVLVSAAVLVVSFFKQVSHFERTLLITDAIGLGMFTVGGIQRSLAYDISPSYAIVLGVMSGTFGGLIADMLSGRVPALLQKGELYATAAAVGGVCYILLIKMGLNANVAMIACVSLVVAVRLISVKKKIGLPQI